jgi:ABC-2 type transport system ATP-binding protein
MKGPAMPESETVGTLAAEATGLIKRYRGQVAVDGIDFTIAFGEICGLLGPNGAGKTTTILMLMGLTEPTAGRIRVLGHDPLRDPLAVKRRVGYLPDSVGFYEQLTARENLRYTARLAGIERGRIEERINESLARVRLDREADRPVKGFSHGMRQRLGLAEVIMKRARLAILDEPTSGLDPQSTHEFLALIRGLRSDGVAVLLSSHLLDRVQEVCDRVFMFQRGKIALQGSVEELARRVLGGGYAIEIAAGGIDFHKALAGIAGIKAIVPTGDESCRAMAESDLRPEIAARIVGAGGRLLRLSIMEPSLDDIYTRHFQGAQAA